MEELLKLLLDKLQEVGVVNDEIYDRECRDQMGDAVFDGFLNPVAGYMLPESFGLYSESGNEKVGKALRAYIASASRQASALGLTAFKDRLKAFQNGGVKSSGAIGRYYDDFFGYMSPEDFDENGNFVGK